MVLYNEKKENKMMIGLVKRRTERSTNRTEIAKTTSREEISIKTNE
jgi:hypothetical protein